jgi:hypothetical protein
VGVMALLMTVVAFVVQMAANRYTTRIVDLFIANRINIFFMSFAAVTTVAIVMILYIGDAGKSLPRVSVFITFLLASLLLISIFPYFIFIFRFIQPSNIIFSIEKETFMNVIKSYQIRSFNQQKRENTVRKLHRNYLNGINQLTDIAQNCIQNKDQTLAIECVRSLRYLMANYIRARHHRPLHSQWLSPSQFVRMDVSFITFAEESTGVIGNSWLWVEDKILKQMELLFRESINKVRSICNYIANSLYIVGTRAIELKNYDVVKKIIMYFNTLLRATINEEDVRTGFNILNQYRKLAERLVDAGEDNLVLEIVNHFKYYGLLAKELKGMYFILETAAHDLCDINKLAYNKCLSKRVEILDIFLTVDMPLEGEKEVSLRGIRKAQIRLAVYYLSRKSGDAVKLARKIYTDMLEELHRPEGFQRTFGMIRELKYSRKDFWEINDREYNFNYCPPEEKKHLQEFLNWFICRLVLLYAVEITKNKKSLKAKEYLKDILAVRDMLPAVPSIDEVEFEPVLGRANLDTRGNFERHMLELEPYLMQDSNLSEEVSVQPDLDYKDLQGKLKAVKVGISSFFKAFTK